MGGRQCTTFPLCSKNPTNNNRCLPYCVETPPLSRAWSHAGGLYIFDIETPEASPEMHTSKQETFLLKQAVKVLHLIYWPTGMNPLQGEEYHSA